MWLSSWPVDDFIDDPVFLGLFGVHDKVPLNVALDAIQRLPGVPGNQVIRNFADAQYLARVNINVRGLPAYPPIDG